MTDWRVRTLNAGFNPFRDVVMVVVLPLMVGNLICWVMP